MFDKMFEFNAAVRGYHYYKRFWQPVADETLQCDHEENNPYDFFAIKLCSARENGSIVGHLPMEISRATKFLLDRGATVTATLTSTYYRISPLVQGGLEIPCKVEIRMPYTVKNKAIVKKYKEIVEMLYCEPDGKEAIGSFLHHGDEIVAGVGNNSKKKKRRNEVEKVSQNSINDIRKFFKKQKNEKSTPIHPDSEDVIVLD